MTVKKDEHQKSDESAEAKPDTDNTSGTDKSNGGEEQGGEPETKFSQADVDRIVSERIQRERDKAERDAQEAQRKAEEEALQKRQEFEQLATQRGDRITALESELKTTTAKLEESQSRIQELETLIANDVKAQIDTLELKASTAQLLERLSVTERREWLNEHREEYAKATRKGARPSPEDKGRKEPHKPDEADAARRQEYYRRAF